MSLHDEHSPGAPGEVDVERYLARIGLRETPSVDKAGLALLQRAHLATVPFENLDIVADVAVRTDASWSLDKVVNRRRGGWCFELNGAFAALLRALGFNVLHLGAAVLHDGPNKVVDHLALEVTLDKAYLVDVGFGESFAEPLALNERGPQTDPAGTFEFIDSSQGTTLTWHDDEGVPVPQYRFRRIHHELAEFDEASSRLQSDPWLQWSNKPFATRLLDASVGGPADRITLKRNRTTLRTANAETDTPVADDDWANTLAELFDMDSPL